MKFKYIDTNGSVDILSTLNLTNPFAFNVKVRTNVGTATKHLWLGTSVDPLSTSQANRYSDYLRNVGWSEDVVINHVSYLQNPLSASMGWSNTSSALCCYSNMYEDNIDGNRPKMSYLELSQAMNNAANSLGAFNSDGYYSPYNSSHKEHQKDMWRILRSVGIKPFQQSNGKLFEEAIVTMVPNKTGSSAKGEAIYRCAEYMGPDRVVIVGPAMGPATMTASNNRRYVYIVRRPQWWPDYVGMFAFNTGDAQCLGWDDELKSVFGNNNYGHTGTIRANWLPNSSDAHSLSDSGINGVIVIKNSSITMKTLSEIDSKLAEHDAITAQKSILSINLPWTIKSLSASTTYAPNESFIGTSTNAVRDPKRLLTQDLLISGHACWDKVDFRIHNPNVVNDKSFAEVNGDNGESRVVMSLDKLRNGMQKVSTQMNIDGEDSAEIDNLITKLADSTGKGVYYYNSSIARQRVGDFKSTDIYDVADDAGEDIMDEYIIKPDENEGGSYPEGRTLNECNTIWKRLVNIYDTLTFNALDDILMPPTINDVDEIVRAEINLSNGIYTAHAVTLNENGADSITSEDYGRHGIDITFLYHLYTMNKSFTYTGGASLSDALDQFWGVSNWSDVELIYQEEEPGQLIELADKMELDETKFQDYGFINYQTLTEDELNRLGPILKGTDRVNFETMVLNTIHTVDDTQYTSRN